MKFIEWFFLNKGREPDGLFSLAHIVTVTVILLFLSLVAINLGRKYKENPKAIDVILKVSAIIMIVLYVAEVLGGFLHLYMGKGLVLGTEEGNRAYFGLLVNSAPLFLCDIAIFSIPLIAFTKGKIRSILSDFMGIWGIPMGVIGTYLAGNVFGVSPVISFDGLLCIFIHVVPMSVTIFLYIIKFATIDKANMKTSLLSFFCFSLFVLVYNYIFGTNFMFFFTGDGTPFDLFRPYVSLPVYQVIVFSLYMSYMILFYYAFHFFKSKVVLKKGSVQY